MGISRRVLAVKSTMGLWVEFRVRKRRAPYSGRFAAAVFVPFCSSLFGENSKNRRTNHGKSKIFMGDGRHRGSALSRFVCKEVIVFSLRDLEDSIFMYIMMLPLSFRVQIASDSLELRVQHGML